MISEIGQRWRPSIHTPSLYLKTSGVRFQISDIFIECEDQGQPRR